MVVLALTACNTAPLDYRALGQAPGGSAGWGWPSERACDRQPDEPDDVVVDGFTLCARDNDIVPVDDPIHEPCAKHALGAQELVFAVTDGVHARGYALDALIGRELVHEDWGTGPLLVDF
jgi:hypothetical protein